MNYKISAPDRLEATVNLPASKSISNRVLVIQALAGGQTVPDGLSVGDRGGTRDYRYRKDEASPHLPAG